MSYKPDGYTSAAPYLLVRDARETLEFLRKVFDAQELRVIPCPPGESGVMHAEARIDDTVVMMGETPEGPEANVHVYVPDVEETYRRALEAGGVSVQAPLRKSDDDLRAGVRDPDCTTWWIATHQV